MLVAAEVKAGDFLEKAEPPLSELSELSDILDSTFERSAADAYVFLPTSENLGNPRSDLTPGSAQKPASQRALARGSINEEYADIPQQMLVAAEVKAGDFLLKAEPPRSDASKGGCFSLQQVSAAEAIERNPSQGLIFPLITTVIPRSSQGIFARSAENTDDDSASESSNASEIIYQDPCYTPHPRILAQLSTQIPRSFFCSHENSGRTLIPHPPQYAPHAHSAVEGGSSLAIKEDSQSESSYVPEVQPPCAPLPREILDQHLTPSSPSPQILDQHLTRSSSASLSQETLHRPLTSSSTQNAPRAHSAVEDDLFSCDENTHLHQQVSVTEFGQIILPLSEGLGSSQTTLTPSIPQGSSRGNPRHLRGPRKSTLSNLGSGTFESSGGQTASFQLLSSPSEAELLQSPNQNATSNHNQASHSFLRTSNGISSSYQLSNSPHQEEPETMMTVMPQRSDSLCAQGAAGESLVELVRTESQPPQTSNSSSQSTSKKREQDSASKRIGTVACTPKAASTEAASTESTKSLSSGTPTTVLELSLAYPVRYIGIGHQYSVDSSSTHSFLARDPAVESIATSVLRQVKLGFIDEVDPT
ncbi:MAG: hypothetical protein NEHIOOID_00668 [Holosporales bacterium]